MKITKKQVKTFYPVIFQAGYCEIQQLENRFRKIGYNSGVYGWNWDAYAVNMDIAIVTGYRSLFGRDLPESACKILKEIKDHKFSGFSNDKEEKYMESVKERFISALIEATNN